jgi:hypothetical protein
MNEADDEKRTEAQAARIEARPTKDPAVRTFILAAMLLGFSVWCLLDWRPMPEAWDTKHINDVAGYLLNNWGPFLLVPAGLALLIRGIVYLSRRLCADQEGIGFAGRQKIPWEQITAVDATALKAKGVLRITWGDGQRMKLCDWHWPREQFRGVVALLEAHVPAGRISR